MARHYIAKTILHHRCYFAPPRRANANLFYFNSQDFRPVLVYDALSGLEYILLNNNIIFNFFPLLRLVARSS
jgi:hypothetical protein